VLHCILLHPFITSLLDKNLYNLAVDIAVENIINEFNSPYLYSYKEDSQNEIISYLKSQIKTLNS